MNGGIGVIFFLIKGKKVEYIESFRRKRQKRWYFSAVVYSAQPAIDIGSLIMSYRDRTAHPWRHEAKSHVPTINLVSIATYIWRQHFPPSSSHPIELFAIHKRRFHPNMRSSIDPESPGYKTCSCLVGLIIYKTIPSNLQTQSCMKHKTKQYATIVLTHDKRPFIDLVCLCFVIQTVLSAWKRSRMWL